MRKTLFTLLILACFQTIAQTDNQPTLPSLTFDNCGVVTRDSVNGEFGNELVFTGSGAIDFYTDSIVLTFANEWECGKYLIHLTDTQEYSEADMHVTLFGGKAEYFGWICSMQLFKYKDGTIDFLLDNNYIGNTAMKRRIYMNLKIK